MATAALEHHEIHSTFTLAGLVAALEGPLEINIYCILIERVRGKHLRGVRGVPIRPWGAAGGTRSPKDLATGPNLSITWWDNEILLVDLSLAAVLPDADF